MILLSAFLTAIVVEVIIMNDAAKNEQGRTFWLGVVGITILFWFVLKQAKEVML